MTWVDVLIAVAVFVAVVAWSGVRPKGARPVGSTGLMSAGVSSS